VALVRATIALEPPKTSANFLTRTPSLRYNRLKFLDVFGTLLGEFYEKKEAVMKVRRVTKRKMRFEPLEGVWCCRGSQH